MQDALQAYGAQAEFGVFYGSFMGAKEEEERVGRSTKPSGSAGFASAPGGTPCAQGHMHQVARHTCGVTGHTCGSPGDAECSPAHWSRGRTEASLTLMLQNRWVSPSPVETCKVKRAVTISSPSLTPP